MGSRNVIHDVERIHTGDAEMENTPCCESGKEKTERRAALGESVLDPTKSGHGGDEDEVQDAVAIERRA
jgi:hypothetical protein